MELNQIEVKEVAETIEFAIEHAQSELTELQLAFVGGGCGVATFG
jgi:hypothetical protein